MLPEDVYAYFRRGAGRGMSVAEATSAWDQFRFRARLLRDVSTRRVYDRTRTPVRTPVLVAPSTLQRKAHPDGQVATARGVAAAGSLLAVTSNTAVPFADLVPSGAPWWCRCTWPGTPC